MTIDINDPRITAFALGELEGEDAVELARAVLADEKVRAAVDEVRETSFLLQSSLGGEAPLLLTREQRQAVRRAAVRPEAAELDSVKVPFWRRPIAVGWGVAAALVVTLFVIQKRDGDMGGVGLADSDQAWDWSDVGTGLLMAPVRLGAGDDGGGGSRQVSDAAHAVAAAISDDAERYREEVAGRVAASPLIGSTTEADAREGGWHEIAGRAGGMPVPLTSGVSSWFWLERYLDEKGALPPSSTVRLEEWLNHVHYQTPRRFKGRQLVADVEICESPWNTGRWLMAVHVAARPGVDLEGASATLVFDGEQVRRVRMLGYAESARVSDLARPATRASKSRGNYVLYEIESAEAADVAMPWVSLRLGEGEWQSVHVGQAGWPAASEDMRFASVVAAAAMLVADSGAAGDLDVARLRFLHESFVQREAGALSRDRSEVMRRVGRMVELLTR